jgi:hypothetical protein
MIKSIKLLKTNFAFAAGLAALIFTACGNDFMEKAFSTLSGPEVVIPAPITWNTNVVYVDPLSGTLSGTVTALLSNGGKRIWFARTQSNSPYKQWEFTVSSDQTLITPGSLASYIGAPVTSNGDLMTLNFFSKDLNADDPVFADVVPCSFILYPDALYGADRDSVSINTATLNFRVEKPSMSVYAKYTIEKGEYGSISVSWEEGSLSVAASAGEEPPPATPDQITAEMQRLAGSLAANSAGLRALEWDADWQNNVVFTDSSGSLSAVSWVLPPNLSKGWAPYKKYAIQLNGFNYSSDTIPPVSPEISAPIQFLSNVGSAATLIKMASDAGSFASLVWDSAVDPVPGNAGSVTTILTELGIPSLLTMPPAVDWSAQPAAPGSYNFSVLLAGGTDGSPGDIAGAFTAIFVEQAAP